MAQSEVVGELRFVETNKGKPKLVYKDYFFIRDKPGANGKILWKCEKNKHCSARVHTLDGKVVHERNQHSHEPIPGREGVIKSVNLLKNRAADEPRARPRDLLLEVGELNEMQQLEAQWRKLQRVRKKMLSTQNLSPKMQASQSLISTE